MKKDELGKKGENEACKFLENLEYFILARNFKCAFGEIDIIAVEKDEIVFIEVKSRITKKYGEGRDAINNTKKKHIKKASLAYVYQNCLENRNIRFDVIEVYLKNEKIKINHIKNTLW